MRSIFKNQTILITGGTGSFGRTFLNKILKVNEFKEVRIFSRDEKKQFDMRKKFNNEKIKFFIGDVRDYNSVLNVMENVDHVFHSAALKQVPSCEFYPMEAVKTNILGTENVLNACNRSKVKKVICLSTDKSVMPVNAMGMSKALMEKVIIAKARNARKNLLFAITRYGNVIGSRGSVIPTFINQAKNKKKMTITDPNMTRFMMTLEEAVELVMYAFRYGENGDIFVKKSPASKIIDIANAISLNFKIKNNIKNIGVRHGEKLHELLLSKEEKIYAKDLGKFYKINLINKKNKLDFINYFSIGKNRSKFDDYSSENTKRLNVKETLKLLKISRVFEQNY